MIKSARYGSFIWAVLLASGWISGARAQDGRGPEDLIISALRPGSVVDVQQRVLADFAQIDSNGDGVYTEDDVTFAGKLRAAQMRTGTIMRWLSSDLDGDGVITVAEFDAVARFKISGKMRQEELEIVLTEEQIERAVAQQRKRLDAIDDDHDGRLTVAEINHSVEDQNRTLGRQRSPRQLPWAIDANADSKVTREEFAAALEKATAEADADNDGMITQSEANRVQEQIMRARSATKAKATAEEPAADTAKPKVACVLPTPSDSDLIAFVGLHSGATLSNIALGPEPLEARIVDVEIEAGTQPIYAVVSSIEPVIWRFKGAVERVSRVVAIGEVRSGAPYAGVSGIARDRVTIPADKTCARQLRAADAMSGARTRAALAQMIARGPETMRTVYRISSIALPSGKTALAPSTLTEESETLAKVAPTTWQRLIRLAPGGVDRLDVGDVVAAGPLKSLTVLPQEAGLIQLIAEGKLVAEGTKTLIVLPNGSTIDPRGGDDLIDLESGSGTTVQQVPLAYRILKPIDFPLGLSGGHSVTFILTKGVAKPTGTPGHSCVIDEGTGETIIGEC